MTALEVVYRLAAILKDHLEKVEDQTSSDLLCTDSINGLMDEILVAYEREYNQEEAARDGSF